MRWLLITAVTLIAGSMINPWMGALGGCVVFVLTWQSGPAEWLVTAQRASLDQIEDHANLHFHDAATRYDLALGTTIPSLSSLAEGRGGLATGDPEFDDRIALVGSQHDWIPLLDTRTRAALRAIMPARYDASRHVIEVRATSRPEHIDFVTRIEQGQALVEHLKALNAQPRQVLLKARLAEATSPGERITVFKVLWHADQTTARAIARSVADAGIAYFVATASTPPDTQAIEAIARDPDAPGRVRTPASLRWFGLVTGIYDISKPESQRRIQADPTIASRFETLIDIWAASAADSERALELLGDFGRPEHAVVLGMQRDGLHGEAARAALGRLKDRFPDLQHGGLLAIASADAGQLGLVEPAED